MQPGYSPSGRAQLSAAMDGLRFRTHAGRQRSTQMMWLRLNPPRLGWSSSFATAAALGRLCSKLHPPGRSRGGSIWPRRSQGSGRIPSPSRTNSLTSKSTVVGGVGRRAGRRGWRVEPTRSGGRGSSPGCYRAPALCRSRARQPVTPRRLPGRPLSRTRRPRACTRAPVVRCAPMRARQRVSLCDVARPATSV